MVFIYIKYTYIIDTYDLTFVTDSYWNNLFIYLKSNLTRRDHNETAKISQTIPFILIHTVKLDT